MLFRSRTFTLSTLSLALFSHFSSAADSELNLDFLQGINMTPSVLKSGTHYPVCRPVLDMLNDVTQPFFWFHIVQTACADQRVQHRRMFATAVGTREHPVFPAYGHSP